MASIADRSVASGWVVLGALGIGGGVYLRATQLSIQILLDDEWHAIHKLLHADAAGIATSFGVADYSIPLTLYYRFLALHGGLSEWQMHVPMLLAGVALLVVAPWLLRRLVAPAVLATWVLLIALSPLLVYLSRTARPYALTCLLTFVAIVAFRNWWRGAPHAKFWGCAYGVSAVVAGWLHLITLPFTLLPFAYYGVRALASMEPDARRGAAVTRLVAMGTAIALPLAAVLVPPMVGSAGQLTQKAATDSVTLASLYRTALMLFGTGSPWVLVPCTALCVAGVLRLRRRDEPFVAYVAFVCIGAAIAIALAGPQWIQHPLVFARYLLPALPFLLLFTAEGAVALVGCFRSRVAAPIVALGGAALFVTGPIPAYLYAPNQFMGHARFQFDYDPAHNPYVLEIPREPIPAFYRDLAQRPARSITLIEAPWSLVSNFDPHVWYQQVHRQYVRIGLVTPVCGVRDFGEFPATTSMLRFSQFVHLSQILAGQTYGADYLVLHPKPWKTPPDAQIDWPDVAACLPTIEARLGAPAYRDDTIVVFDLRRRHAH